MMRDRQGVPRRALLRAAAGAVPLAAIASAVTNTEAANATTILGRFQDGQPVITPTADALQVQWSAIENAVSYRVLSARNTGFTVALESLDGLAETSTTVSTLDARLLGPASGNYSFVKVVASNGEFDSWGDPVEHSSAVAVTRPTPVQPNPAGTPLTVATYNVLATQSSPSSHSWTSRRRMVAKTIRNRMPDVIGLQEASPLLVSTQVTGFFTKKKKGKKVAKPRRTQFKDLQYLLAGSGYALDTEAKMNAGSHSKAYHGGRILYNAKTVRLIKRRTEWLRGTSRASDRYASIALFQSIGTGAYFVFASAHLTPKDSASLDQLRGAQITQLISAIDRFNPSGYPAVVVGDFNTTQLRVNPIAHANLLAAGFFDARGAVTQYGTSRPTFNGFNTKAPTTWNDSRMDYILVKGAPGAVWYRNVYGVNANGTYKTPHASDHNIQLAQLMV